jgi:hypothetical protein
VVSVLVIVLIAVVLFMSTAVLVAPAVIVITLFQSLVGPMPGLIAIGSAFSLVPGPDPAGTSFAGLFPTPRGPGPSVTLTVPVTGNPHVVMAGSLHPHFVPRRGRSIRSDANSDRTEVHTYPHLGKGRRTGERHEHCG